MPGIKTFTLAEIQLVSVPSLNRDFYLDFLAVQDQSVIQIDQVGGEIGFSDPDMLMLAGDPLLSKARRMIIRPFLQQGHIGKEDFSFSFTLTCGFVNFNLVCS